MNFTYCDKFVNVFVEALLHVTPLQTQDIQCLQMTASVLYIPRSKQKASVQYEMQ